MSDEYIECVIDECSEKVYNNKWTKINAANEGWLFLLSPPKAYCPGHLPDWLDDWRKNRS